MTPSLFIKTYFAKSVQAAVALARYELGPDAVLMNSREAPADAQHLGKWEVVFAANPATVQEQSAAQLDLLLERNGVGPELIRDVLKGLAPGRRELAARMEGMIATEPVVGRLTALVGPPGRGKTSTVAKLAVRHGSGARLPVRVLTIDNLHAGAGRQLASFCSKLGAGFQFVQTAAQLDRALKGVRGWRGLTLIDTAGYGPKDVESGADVARCLCEHGAETHLTLRSDARTAELLAAVERFRMFQPTRLIFTGLDESASFGNLFTTAVEARLPVSFLCSGQAIPEDLEGATPQRIVGLVLQEVRSTERAAA